MNVGKIQEDKIHIGIFLVIEKKKEKLRQPLMTR